MEDFQQKQMFCGSLMNDERVYVCQPGVAKVRQILSDRTVRVRDVHRLQTECELPHADRISGVHAGSSQIKITNVKQHGHTC